jgi:hypothetical protein
MSYNVLGEHRNFYAALKAISLNLSGILSFDWLWSHSTFPTKLLRVQLHIQVRPDLDTEKVREPRIILRAIWGTSVTAGSHPCKVMYKSVILIGQDKLGPPILATS